MYYLRIFNGYGYNEIVGNTHGILSVIFTNFGDIGDIVQNNQTNMQEKPNNIEPKKQAPSSTYDWDQITYHK